VCHIQIGGVAIHLYNTQRKAARIKGVSDLLFEVLGKPHNATTVVIDEVELENWGVGGLPVPEYRKQLPQSEDNAK
jgi:4-oxalocrotonate tautomerase